MPLLSLVPDWSFEQIKEKSVVYRICSSWQQIACLPLLPWPGCVLQADRSKRSKTNDGTWSYAVAGQPAGSPLHHEIAAFAVEATPSRAEKLLVSQSSVYSSIICQLDQASAVSMSELCRIAVTGIHLCQSQVAHDLTHHWFILSQNI